MLRAALLILACLLIAAGIIFPDAGYVRAWPLVWWGGVLLAAVLLESWRYRQPEEIDPGEWQKTDECFIDPETGQSMQVLFHPGTGERRYVRAAGEGEP